MSLYETGTIKISMARSDLFGQCSAEITGKEIASLSDAKDVIPAGTSISVAYINTESMDQRVNAAKVVRQLGFEPMPHLAARRFCSHQDLETFLARLKDEANVKRAFLIAGDASSPQGPFQNSLEIIEMGILERYGINLVGIAGHPEGHPVMSKSELADWMSRKVSALDARGIESTIVTQMAFDADAVVQWIEHTRGQGISVPIRIGVPGPASIKQLLRFAKICGVGASTSVLKKYGISLTNLLGNAGPNRFVDDVLSQLTESHGRIRFHFYPLGDLFRTYQWIRIFCEEN